MTDMPTLAEDVRAVRDYIDANGWIQGNFHDDDGGCCLEGARLGLPRITDPLASELRHLRLTVHLQDMIEQRGDVEVGHRRGEFGDYRVAIRRDYGPTHDVALIPHFNDHVLQSKTEVLEFLDKAAIAAEEKVV